MERVKLIVIAGPSASGKTTFVEALYRELHQYISVLSTDNYFHPFSHLNLEHRSQQNFDHPNSIDTELLLHHISKMKQGLPIITPKYDFTQHTRLTIGTPIHPKPVIIVEGLLALTIMELVEISDLKVFINTPLDICLARKIKRDITDRGRTLAQSMQQYERTVRPMYYQFTQPSKNHADLLLPDGGNISKSIELMRHYIVDFVNQGEAIEND